MTYFILGGKLRLTRNPNWPDRVCDSHVLGLVDGETKLSLIHEGGVTAYDVYELDTLPPDFRPELQVPLLPLPEAMILFNEAVAKSSFLKQRVGQVLFDMCVGLNLMINVDNVWYLSDLITRANDFYYEEDIGRVRDTFFKQFSSY